MATKQISYRKGTDADHSTFTGVDGEVTINVDTHRLHTHDGATVGGFEHAFLDDIPIFSVAGKTGDVVLYNSDINEETNLFYTDERVDDRINTLLENGTNIVLTYDDTNNILTIDGPIVPIDSVAGKTGAVSLDTNDVNEGTNLFYTDERVDDYINSLLVSGTNITLTYNDGAGSLTVDGPSVPIDSVAGRTGDVTLDTDDLNEGSNLFYTDERVDERVSALLASGTNITLTYDDVNNSLTIDGPIVPVDSLEGRTGDVVFTSADIERDAVPNEDATNPANWDQKGAAVDDQFKWDGTQWTPFTPQNTSFKNLSVDAKGKLPIIATDFTIDMSVNNVFEIEPQRSTNLDFTGFASTGRARSIVNIINGGLYTVSYSSDGGAGTVFYDGNSAPVLYKGVGFDLTTASYYRGYVQIEDRSLANSAYTSLAFNNDGRKMFVMNEYHSRIHQYNLTTPFDLATASKRNLINSISISITAKCIAFNNDGTKMIVSSGSTIYTYTLSTGFDITTASSDGVSFDFSGQIGSEIDDMVFKPDGTKMFLVEDSPHAVYQYTLSTGFDISTANYDNVSKVWDQDGYIESMAFNANGTKMVIVARETNDTMYQYTLTTGFDLTTESYDGVSFNVSGQDPIPRCIRFNNSGEKIFLLGKYYSRVFEYHLSTDYDISTIEFKEDQYNDSYIISKNEVIVGIRLSTDGTKMFILHDNLSTIYQYSLATAFDIKTASYDGVSFDFTSQNSTFSSMDFNPTGTKLFMLDYNSFDVYQYTLTNGFDLSTISDYDAYVGVNGDTAIKFNNDGTKMFLVQATTDKIYQYTLSTGFDISTANYDNIELDVNNAPLDIAFNADGTKIYVLNGGEFMYQYSLPRPFNLKQATYDNVSYHFSDTSYCHTFTFSLDGTKIFIGGDVNEGVFRYLLDRGSFVDELTVTQDSSNNVLISHSNPS